jgi:hypothetical protein
VPTDTYLNRLQGDIKKAVLLDIDSWRRRYRYRCFGNDSVVNDRGATVRGIIWELRIRYRHLRSDPTARINKEELRCQCS